MNTDFSLKTFCGCMVLLAILPLRGVSQAAPAAHAAPAIQSAQSASVCNGRAACYETSDFAAIMTDFRVSTAGYWKLIDTTLHFQNKTNQPLTLGYTEGSAMAIDDQGNRFGLAGQPNAVRGIGRIVGNNIDPKFSLPPGGAGDTMFELAWAPGNATQGVNFELDLSIREINALEGRQYSVAGESPLQFRGLSNGIFGGSAGATASPGAAGLLSASGSPVATAATPVCGSANTASTLAANMNSVAGQNVPAGANSAISNATASFSNLKSMFGRKKAAATATTTTSSVAPCVPASPATEIATTASPSSSSAAVAAPTSTTSATAASTPAPVAQPAVRAAQTTPAPATTVAHTTAEGTPVAHTTVAATPVAHPTTVTTVKTTKTTVTAKPAAKTPAPSTSNN